MTPGLNCFNLEVLSSVIRCAGVMCRRAMRAGCRLVPALLASRGIRV